MNQPLTPHDCDLRGLPFMPLDVIRLIDSDLFALSTGDEFKAAVALWCKSWTQIPAGSLPTDDRVLAHLSGAGTRWKKVKEMALRGWITCDDGRLYHPVVAEKATEAMNRREEFKAAKGADADRKRQEREDRKAIFAELRSRGLVLPASTKTCDLRAALSQAKSVTSHASVTVTGHEMSHDGHAPVTAKTGTGTGTIYNNTNSAGRHQVSRPAQPDGRKRFRMFVGWKPADTFLTDRGSYGFRHDVFTPQAVAEFCGYWETQPDELTQGEWEHKLGKQLIVLSSKPAPEARAARPSRSGNPVPDNTTTDWLTPELVERYG